MVKKKKSTPRQRGLGTPLVSWPDPILISVLNVFTSAVPQISYRRNRNIQMYKELNITGRNTKQYTFAKEK